MANSFLAAKVFLLSPIPAPSLGSWGVAGGLGVPLHLAPYLIPPILRRCLVLRVWHPASGGREQVGEERKL